MCKRNASDLQTVLDQSNAKAALTSIQEIDMERKRKEK